MLLTKSLVAGSLKSFTHDSWHSLSFTFVIVTQICCLGYSEQSEVIK